MSGQHNMSTVLTADKAIVNKLSLDNISFNQYSVNERSIDDSSAHNSNNVIKTDVLIIGAGLAGLSTALALPKSLSVTILSKAALETCSSHYAQGGIAASLDENDNVADHVADTLIAGAGLCATDNTTTILSAGQQAVQWLCAQGVPFTQIPQQDLNSLITNTTPTTSTLDELKTTALHLTQEGGHGCRRVAHADDATGRHIMQTLSVQAQAASNITILPYHEALSLLTEPLAGTFTKAVIGSATKPPAASLSEDTFATRSKSSSHSQYSKGALVFDHNTQRQLTFHSRAVVLASGGLGQLFQRASAPNVCVGDGVMMAWQAGCRVGNLEFIQFHPTGLALDDSSFLISEALRGEGGRLYCPQTGKRFMLDIDSRAELAPRDIVARAISEQITNNGLGYVHLDVSHLPARFLQQHFPQIYQTLLDLGIDITTDPIPVAPTAHYSCGGVVTCAEGLTDIPGLYAAGEVAYTGLHGANRLASNSLLECVVVGRNIADHLPRYLEAMPESPIDSKFNTNSNTESTALTTNIWASPKISNAQAITLPSTAGSPLSDHKAGINVNTDDITIKLKSLMSNNMGIMRSAEKLEQALVQIQHWQQTVKESSSVLDNLTLGVSSMDELTAINRSIILDKLANFQLTRQLHLATLIIQSAYQRCESRGGHYRQDYPQLASMPLISIIEPLTSNTDTIEEPRACLQQAIVSSNNGAKQLQGLAAV